MLIKWYFKHLETTDLDLVDKKPYQGIHNSQSTVEAALTDKAFLISCPALTVNTMHTHFGNRLSCIAKCTKINNLTIQLVLLLV